ncbi:hypothetical protein EI015_27070, partial [Escherichia coli]|nr:hypothetical protein [Escherichia coli]
FTPIPPSLQNLIHSFKSINMGLKGFVEGGIASIIAGCSTHPLDLIKVRMQLQGEPKPIPVHNLRPALSFQTGSSIHVSQPPQTRPSQPRVGPMA